MKKNEKIMKEFAESKYYTRSNNHNVVVQFSTNIPGLGIHMYVTSVQPPRTVEKKLDNLVEFIHDKFPKYTIDEIYDSLEIVSSTLSKFDSILLPKSPELPMCSFDHIPDLKEIKIIS